MNISQPQPNSLPDSDLELLSAFIDDQLDAPDRAAVERRLGAEPRLRAELDDLQTTAALLRDLAPLAPPRSFTLDPASAPRRRPFLALAWFTQLSGGLAGLSLVLLASVQILLGSAGSAAMAPAPMMAPESARPASTAEAPMAAPFAAPEATPAPAAALEMAPKASEAPAEAAANAQRSTAARSTAEGESMASDTGADGGSQAAGAAPAATPAPTVALSASGLSSPDTASPELPAPPPPPPARQPAPPFLRSPATLLGLGVALIALALGAFLYRRR